MIIVITGATSGIGRQLALDYHAEGHEVWALGRSAEALKELTDQGLKSAQVDLLERAQSLAWFATLERVDLAILAAGTCEYIDLPDFDSALVSRVMRANVETMAIAIEGLLPLLRNSDNPKLVGVGSSAAYLPMPRAEAYGASKAAIRYLLDTLRISLKKEGIWVSHVCPGFVKTPLTDRNDFSMPFLIEPEQASAAIRSGIARNHIEIHFPKKFTLLLKALAWLPQGLWCRLAQRMVRS